jgi:hypothetical protein
MLEKYMSSIAGEFTDGTESHTAQQRYGNRLDKTDVNADRDTDRGRHTECTITIYFFTYTMYPGIK